MRSAAIVISVSATAISPRRSGSVTAKNSRTRAGAVDARGVVEALRDLLHAGHEAAPARGPSSPTCRRSPTAGSAQVKSPSQAFASDAEADRLERAGSAGPSGCVDHLPDHRDDDQRRSPAAGRARCGTAPGPRIRAARERRDEQQRRGSVGMHRVEDDQDERVLERVAQLGRLPDLLVVVEPDPGLRASARPRRRARGRSRGRAARARTARRTRTPAAGTGSRSAAARPAGRGARAPRSRAGSRSPEAAGAGSISSDSAVMELRVVGVDLAREVLRRGLAGQQLLDRGRDRVVHRRRRLVEVRDDRVRRR